MELDVGATFASLLKNLKITDEVVGKIRYRYNRMTKQLNKDFWDIDNETQHSLYVGSYGRDTDIVTSDIDWLFILPSNLKGRYDSYQGNGQSALLTPSISFYY